jgi:hypothetical protein
VDINREFGSLFKTCDSKGLLIVQTQPMVEPSAQMPHRHVQIVRDGCAHAPHFGHEPLDSSSIRVTISAKRSRS